MALFDLDAKSYMLTIDFNPYKVYMFGHASA